MKLNLIQNINKYNTIVYIDISVKLMIFMSYIKSEKYGYSHSQLRKVRI